MQQIQNNSNAIDRNPSEFTEFSPKETRPQLAGGSLKKDETSSTYHLVEQMQYLYVKVVKARDMSTSGVVELVAEVVLGNYSEITKTAGVGNIEWDQVFAFSRECIQSSTVEIIVKDGNEENHMGRVWFDLRNVPSRGPAESQLVPQWYKMEHKTGEKAKTGELMISIWFGTQDDEAFAEAWNSPKFPFDGLSFIKSKVYHSPKLWYLRVSVIEAEHIMPGHTGPEVLRFPDFYAKVQVGSHCLETRIAAPSATRSFSNPYWNEDLLFVVEEPFVNSMSVWVQDRLGPCTNVGMAMVELPVAPIEKRVDEIPVTSNWFDLQISHFGEAGQNNLPSTRFVPRSHLRLSFDGGYHVFDEIPMNSSDVRPTDTSLWKPHIGVLEMRILGASGLVPMKIEDSGERGLNAYCIAKYGQKWCRTRTVVDSLSPKWNEQFSWEVYDLCTVVTVGFFDNGRMDKNVAASDHAIGKVRITLSTLETDRVYSHSFPLLMLHQSFGVKKMGELHLRIRLSCSNVAKMLLMYTMPLLPNMHFVDPLTGNQLQSLRNQAKNLLASRLSREEPPMGREVVAYMLDHDMWNPRRSKANFSRLMAAFSGLISIGRYVESIRAWQKPLYSALFLIIFLTPVLLPEFILPAIIFLVAFVGLWGYYFRPRYLSWMSATLPSADLIHPDELDEEFDTFPTSRPPHIVRLRYDRLRSVAGRIQTLVGCVAALLEGFEALLSWTDPQATFLYLVMCLVAAFGFYIVPIRVVIALSGLYFFRPPWFRSSQVPSVSLNFLKRLPTAEESGAVGKWEDILIGLLLISLCLLGNFQ